MEYIVEGKQMKEIDRRTIEDIGIPALVLMERAAECIAMHAQDMLCDKGQPGQSGTDKPVILALYGRGGNGGDALAAARILHLQGYAVELCAVADEDKLCETAAKELDIARRCGVAECREAAWQIDFAKYALVLDGIFGIGLSRAVDERFAALFQKIEGSGVRVLGIDIPSGLSADTGEILGACIPCERTVTFGYRKVGQMVYPGAEVCGEVCVEDIGFPAFLAGQVLGKPYTYYTYNRGDEGRLPERKAHSHKGTYGHVLVWAGSQEITGAAYLAAQAAYRSGVGLVKLLSAPECIQTVRGMMPELLTGIVSPQAGAKEIQSMFQKELAWADVVLAGPGLGQSAELQGLLGLFLQEIKKAGKPLVLDADAINLLAAILEGETPGQRIAELSELLPSPVVLTPHPKELSGLLKMPVAQITGHAVDTARQCIYNNKLIWVLKDARTIVAHDGQLYINTSGCDGMATGGSGDVLAGLIAGLTVSMEAFEAAKMGVFLHGRAGECASEKRSRRAMLAGDMLEEFHF